MYLVVLFVVLTLTEARNCDGNSTTGERCDDDNQGCQINPCMNNGSCITNGNDYQCSCPSGYSGKNCQFSLNYCSSTPCINGGTCEETSDGFLCKCNFGWKGTTCDVPSDPCNPNPCQNNGTCNPDQARGFNCSCKSGFKGLSCEINIDDCESVQCDNHKICFDLVNGYECRCPIGYSGDSCNERVNYCDSNPCQNGGSCNNSFDTFVCTCPSNFTGVQCETDVDECETISCNLPNGICKNFFGSYQCYCIPGYSGDFCSINVDECLSAPCLNNGTCQDHVNGYKCNCAPGFTGVLCEVDIDECQSHPCYNDATCVDQINAFQCICQPGFTGNKCEVDIDECESQPCQNEGQCLDHVNGFTCNCTDTGFTGDFCENNIDDCDFNSCYNNGTCVDLVKDYRCNCFAGYTGKRCETDIDECAERPCDNEGMCLENSKQNFYHDNYLGLFNRSFTYELAAGYVCHCKLGFRGENCSENIDDCVSHLCENGTCVDGINNYTCECFHGFRGDRCQVEINECIEYEPCFNGATCSNTIGDYVCRCPPNFGGKNCSVELIGCVGNKCENNATCDPFLIGETNHSYECLCQHGFHGRLCEKITTLSLNRSDPINILTKNLNNEECCSFSFRFRTTLREGILFSGRNSTTKFNLVLHDTSLLFTIDLNDFESYSNQISKNLNDGHWQTVIIDFNPNNVSLNLGLDRDNELFVNFSLPTIWSFSDLYLGNSPWVIFPDQYPFIGCMEDLMLNKELITPEMIINTPGTSMGCPREEQCLKDTCSQNGVCSDLWNTFSCSCRRPFLGPQCSRSITPATFGFENSTSTAILTFPQIDQEELERYSNISLFIRTRKKDGVVFYLGKENYIVDATFMALEIRNGVVNLVIKSGDKVQLYTTPKRIDDGYYHLIEFVMKRQTTPKVVQVTMKINETVVLNNTSSLSMDFVAVKLYLGNIPVEGNVRMTRQLSNRQQSNPQTHVPYDIHNADIVDNDDDHSFFAHSTLIPMKFDNADGNSEERYDFSFTNIPRHTESTTPNILIDFKQHSLDNDLSGVEAPINNIPFKGVLQDLRVNEKLVLFYPVLIPDIHQLIIFENDSLINVKEGVVSDDSCKSLPCEFGGTCIVTWNDYECACVEGYRGKNCSHVDYCYSQSCPAGGRCVNLIDGYQCISNATFSGENNYVSYNTSVFKPNTTLDSISFKYRSQYPGLILTSYDLQSKTRFGVYINNNSITLYYPTSSPEVFSFNQNLTDGSERHVFINYNTQDSTVTVKIEDEDIKMKSPDAKQGFGMLTTGEISVGGNPNGMEENWSYFKGCLSEIQLGQFLLPFFHVNQLGGDSSPEFQVKHMVNVTNGECILCFKNSCQNGGFCTSPYESFDCECEGYTGQFCEFDIDECLTTECKNGVCVNKMGSFDCVCQDGYEGKLCDQDIDECALPEPICKHDGICLNLDGNYSCSCSANYTGKNCENLRIVTCENKPCKNGGTCNSDEISDVYNKYKCHCRSGYTGDNCENERDFCHPPPDCNEGTCISDPEAATYSCNCKIGFGGKHCEINIDDCELSPCLNGATCIDGVNNFTCNCPEGYTGFTCAEDINECEVFEPPCDNDGACVNKNGTYLCICPVGVFGKRCSHPDPCTSDFYCANEAICTPDETNLTGLLYTCSCIEPFAGQHCEERQVVDVFDAGSLALILGPVVGCILLIAVVAVVIFFMMARKKRATRGTYSPSRQEMFGSRVELGHVMKPPPEERLI